MVSLPHVHWYRHVAEVGGYAYSECRCGSRRARELIQRGGLIPVLSRDDEWLAGDSRYPKPPPPPRIPPKRPSDAGIPPSAAVQLKIDRARLARAQAEALELDNAERRKRLRGESGP
jgi:hypothetical protein